MRVRWNGISAALMAAGMLVLAGCGSHQAAAPAFPTRPITVIIPYPPGGASDIITRIVDKFTVPVFGHHFIFRYDPGASGGLGATDIADSPPNGYTIGAYNFPEISVQPAAGVGHYQTSSFSYIAQMVSDPQTIATLKGSPYTTLSALISAARQHPGRITVGIPGLLDGTEFVLLQLEADAHVKFTMIPFSGGGPLSAALLGKHIDAAMINFSLSKPIAPDVNFLAVSTPHPYSFLPGVKTFTQQGYPIVFADRRIYVAPKGLPPKVLATLRKGFQEIYNNPKFQALMTKDDQPLGYLSGPAIEKICLQYQSTGKRLLQKYGLLAQ